METVEFKPDIGKIEERSKIVPYGRASKQHIQEAVPVPFVLYNTEKTIQCTDEQSAIYRPSTFLHSSMVSKLSSDVSVRITNIPVSLSQNDVVDLILKKAAEETGEPSAQRLFTRIYLVLDRETRVSRGYAYANCENIEKARELARIARNITIDACVLGAEVLDKTQ